MTVTRTYVNPELSTNVKWTDKKKPRLAGLNWLAPGGGKDRNLQVENSFAGTWGIFSGGSCDHYSRRHEEVSYQNTDGKARYQPSQTLPLHLRPRDLG